MKYKILHESSGRMRLHFEKSRLTLQEADQLEAYLSGLDGVRQATVYERTCDAVILFREGRSSILNRVAVFRFDRDQRPCLESPVSGEAGEYGAVSGGQSSVSAGVALHRLYGRLLRTISMEGSTLSAAP